MDDPKLKARGFFQQISFDLPKRDLKDFFITKKGLWIDDDFQEVLQALIRDSSLSPAETVVRSLYEKVETIDDETIEVLSRGRIFKISNPNDVLEMKRRLNIMATALENQWNGKAGYFKNDGNVNIMFRVELKTERIISIVWRWYSLGKQWDCDGWQSYAFYTKDIRLLFDDGS